MIKARKCNKNDGSTNIKTHAKGGISVNKKNPNSTIYPYCPAKATWYPQIIDLFNHCRVTTQTGILPKEGGLEDQDEIFADVFPMFSDMWKALTYQNIWKDVQEYGDSILKIFTKS